MRSHRYDAVLRSSNNFPSLFRTNGWNYFVSFDCWRCYSTNWFAGWKLRGLPFIEGLICNVEYCLRLGWFMWRRGISLDCVLWYICLHTQRSIYSWNPISGWRNHRAIPNLDEIVFVNFLLSFVVNQQNCHVVCHFYYLCILFMSNVIYFLCS